MRTILSVSVVLILFSPSIKADSDADSLLRSVGDIPTTDAPEVITAGNISLETLDDSLLRQLYAEWRSHDRMSPVMQDWVKKILSKDYRAASHLYSVVKKNVDSRNREILEVGHLYTLYKLGLPQSFVDLWIEQARRDSFLSNRMTSALEQTVVGGFDKWLFNAAPYLPESASSSFANPKWSKSALSTHFEALVALRVPKRASLLLNRVSADNSFKVLLSYTVVLDLVRKKKLGEAGKVLKVHLEPAVKKAGSEAAKALYALNLARLLYQAGAYDAASKYYLSIPDNSPLFLSAREEYVWTLLRHGNSSELRGEIKTLTEDIFEDSFTPEKEVVGAVSNLKLCYYDKVQESINRFVEQNKRWASKIDQALSAQPISAPDIQLGIGNDYISYAERSVSNLNQEVKKVNQLAEESIEAALPAMGIQPHWKNLSKELSHSLENSLKTRDSEYRKFWTQKKIALREAIRKMRYVKVEFLSQIRKRANDGIGESGVEQIKTSSAAPLRTESGEIAFLYDGVFWPDEMFRLRSVAQSNCLRGLKQ